MMFITYYNKIPFLSHTETHSVSITQTKQNAVGTVSAKGVLLLMYRNSEGYSRLQMGYKCLM